MSERAGWFRVKASGALVRATEAGGWVCLHDGTGNRYMASAFEWLTLQPKPEPKP